MPVSEFPGERVNGILQNVKTNHHTRESLKVMTLSGIVRLTGMYMIFQGEMDGTMMRKTCQVQRFLANHPVPEAEDKQPKKPRTRTIILKLNTYDLLLKYVQKKNPRIWAYSKVPHLIGSEVLTRYASPVRHHPIHKETHNFLVSPMAPNNCVCYTELGRRRYAMVTQVYQYAGPSGPAECAVLVRPVRNLFGKDLKSPSKQFRYTLYLMRAVVGEIGEEDFFLNPNEITSMAAYRLLPNHTFGLKNGGIILTSLLFSQSFTV